MKLDDITIKVWRAIIDFNRNSENEQGVTKRRLFVRNEHDVINKESKLQIHFSLINFVGHDYAQ